MDEKFPKSSRQFSVLMSVYAGEDASHLDEALASLCSCEELPMEVVLVEDGPLTPELETVVEKYRSRLPVASLKLKVNAGLGQALDAGLRACQSELVARFDTDDICMPLRFTEQIDFLFLNPEVAALGAWVEEFEAENPRQGRLRIVPADPVLLKDFAKLRNPLNHPAVMFRRSVVLKVGGYQNELAFEDYSLWLRLLQGGFQLANIPKVLVKMRAGPSQTKRRMGLGYARRELQFAWKFLRLGYFNWFQYLRFVVCRVPLRLLPAALLGKTYARFGREMSSGLN